MVGDRYDKICGPKILLPSVPRIGCGSPSLSAVHRIRFGLSLARATVELGAGAGRADDGASMSGEIALSTSAGAAHTRASAASSEREIEL